jgi:hypothetical protein
MGVVPGQDKDVWQGGMFDTQSLSHMWFPVVLNKSVLEPDKIL